MATLRDKLRSRSQNARDVLATERFQSQLALVAERLKRPLAEVKKEARVGMHEIASTQNLAFTAM